MTRRAYKQEAIQHYPRWKKKLFITIFGTHTLAGKIFDVLLLIAIVASLIVVMLESVVEIERDHGKLLRTMEWIFTVMFTIEYIVRIIAVIDSWKYIRSFYGIIDLLAVIPTYLSLIVPGAQTLLVLRSIRLLRVFRIFKLMRFLGEASQLAEALKASRHKIVVFLGTVLSLVIIMGTFMYLIEHGQNGFTSIPRSIYWAIVTLTTVGYGDIAPQTVLGQVMASIIMIMGYSIIAVPTGIVTAEIVTSGKPRSTSRQCANCASEDHDDDAVYCKSCGYELDKGQFKRLH